MKFIVTRDDDDDKKLKDIQRGITSALESAVRDTAKLAVQLGRSHIAAAGFPASWGRGVKYKFYRNRETGSPAATVYAYKANARDRVGLIAVFERGVTIAGKPLLWLPVEKNLPRNVKSPQEYGGKLVSVNVAGKAPMLFDPSNRLRGPLFVGVRSVNIRKRLDLVRVWTQASEHLGEFLEERLRELDNA